MTGALPAPEVAAYRDGEASRPALVWRLAEPMLAAASTPIGGGIGIRHWIVNAQVALEYSRTDLEAHIAAIGAELGCVGPGVGFLTAAAIDGASSAVDGDVSAHATVGLRHPTLAAAPDDASAPSVVGTINIVVGVPVRLTQAALVNAVITCTEAKTQALRDHDVLATGTASDAVCVVCPAIGIAEPFAGPRAPVGARIARAVYAAVGRGTRAASAADQAPRP
ncbi:MAG: adenosylcobinamide amidohydrolase [Acidimicrobiia bacterium]